MEPTRHGTYFPVSLRAGGIRSVSALAADTEREASVHRSPPSGQDVSMTRRANECFEILTEEHGLKRSSVANLLGALLGFDNTRPTTEVEQGVSIVIRERDTRHVLVDDPRGDAALAEHAKHELASLDEAEFRSRWDIPH